MHYIEHVSLQKDFHACECVNMYTYVYVCMLSMADLNGWLRLKFSEPTAGVEHLEVLYI